MAGPSILTYPQAVIRPRYARLEGWLDRQTGLTATAVDCLQKAVSRQDPPVAEKPSRSEKRKLLQAEGRVVVQA